MRRFHVPLLLAIAACSASGGSVYDEPLPAAADSGEMLKIERQLNGEDLDAWHAVEEHIRVSGGTGLRSKTVGEAIARWKERRSCMQMHARAQEAPGADLKAINRAIDAFNDCLQRGI